MHTPISPSSFERRLLCHGSYFAEKDLPDVTSIYANEGTLLHKVMEQISTKGKYDEDIILTSEQQEIIEYTIKLLDKYNGNSFFNYYEYEVDLSFLGIDIKGTCDRVIIEPSFYDSNVNEYTKPVLHIIDYKFGKGIKIDVKNNYQLALYAIGVLKKFHDHEYFYDADINNNGFREVKVVLHIVQPYLNNYQTIELSSSDYLFNIDFYANIIKKCLDENAIRTPNEKACRFCKAKINCPALKNIIPTNFEINKSDEELKIILDNKNLIINYLKSLEEHIKNRIEEGEKFKGYTIRKKNTNRTWNKDAYEVLTSILQDDAFEKKLIGITKAERLIGKEIINTITEKKEGEYELVNDNLENEKIISEFKIEI